MKKGYNSPYYVEGLYTAIKVLPYMKEGKHRGKNRFMPHTYKGKQFSKGFSFALNNFKFLPPCSNQI